MITAQEISSFLPHKFPMLMVDRIIELESGNRVLAIKNVTINESYFPGHFPGSPVMPGVLIVECMAQTAALVFNPESNAALNGKFVAKPKYLVKIDQMKFVRKVTPGDQLVVEVRLFRSFAQLVQVSASARVDGALVASGKLTFSG